MISAQKCGVVRTMPSEDEMKEEYSKHSLLRSGMPSDDRLIASIINTTEKHIRAMCRVMQVYELKACDRIDNLEADHSDLVDVFAAFYDYVDRKMDVLSELSEELEDGLSWVSLNRLKASEDFQRQPLPPQAFVSRDAYVEYCDRHGYEPVSASRQKIGS
jgi:hypothetical protein